MNLASTIKNITLNHLNSGGMIMGQCLTAVGWVGGTIPEVPDHSGMIELSMADVAGGAIAVGCALSNRRPIYVVRYQGFLWYNLPSIVNYAAKSKELWDTPCPMFIRAISMEGKIGPVAGSSHISLAYRMPGIRISSPMTPKEYEEVWDDFMDNNDPYICSEHRQSFSVDYETPEILEDNPDVVLICISVTRFEALKAIQILKSDPKYKNIKISFIPLVYIKPIKNKNTLINQAKSAKYGTIILDNDYPDGIIKSIAYDLNCQNILVMGLEERSAGFSDSSDNLPPKAETIVEKIKDMI